MLDKFLKIYQKYGVFIIFIALFIGFSITQNGFLKLTNLMNILRQISIYGICVAGVSFVMLSGGSDLSVGGQIACSGLLMADLMVNRGLPIIFAVLVGIIFCALVGYFNGFISAKFNIMPMMVTLCTMLILNGIALVVTGGYPIYGVSETFKFLGQGSFGFLPVPVVFLASLVYLAWFIQNRTYFGRKMYALGGNKEAARLAGININKTRIQTYVISSCYVAIGSMLMLARTASAVPTAASSYPFDVMTAACLGGISFGGGSGNVLKSFAGVLVIGVLANGLVLAGIDSNMQQVIKGFLLLIAIILDALQKNRSMN
jgi:ribose transport system permease protein